MLTILYWDDILREEKPDTVTIPGRILDLDLGDAPSAASIRLYRIADDDWRNAGLTNRDMSLTAENAAKLIRAVGARYGI